MRHVIAVSGPIAVGKSAFISELVSRFGAVRVSTRELIQRIRTVPSERRQLQEAGEALDRETDGKWVADALAPYAGTLAEGAIIIVDSVRIAKQVEHLRNGFGDKVWHVHLTASPEVLLRRFSSRMEKGRPAVIELASYEEARANATEREIEKLGDTANARIVTDRLEPGSVATLAVEGLRLYPTSIKQLVDVVVGGQYGSEGKGNICDYIAGEYGVLVRVGGPNAGHRVANPKYDYVQMPSGTGSNPKAQILIGAGATLNIVRVFKEIVDLQLSPARLSIDPQAIVVEQSDRDFEEVLAQKIGSTKKGVGAATARKILGRDGGPHLGACVRLVRDIPELKPFMRSVTAELENAYVAGKRVLLEGTQGTDLSIHHGLYPSVTSRETTASGCLADAGISPRRVDRIYMVTRTYPIRVGGESGEMGVEIDFETVAKRSGLPLVEISATEVGTVSGKQRRIAEFSWDRVRRAAQLNGATDIVLTFADYISRENRDARTFGDLTKETKEMITSLERLTSVPVTLIAVGFGRDKIIDRRGRALTPQLLWTRFPYLWHMAEPGSWPSIRAHGLLSTRALLDRLGINGSGRAAIESERRPECVAISKEGMPVTVIRDQKPMSDGALQKCLEDGLKPADWYRMLNERTFFWLSRVRLRRLLGARAYREKEQVVLTVDTRSIVEAHAGRIELSPINSGSTIFKAVPRGMRTFLPIDEYDHAAWSKKRPSRDTIVELVVRGGVPDIRDHVIAVHDVAAGVVTEIWRRPGADAAIGP